MTSRIWPTVLGSTRYEFSMQVRRKALWIAMIAVSLIIFRSASSPWRVASDAPLSVVIADWAVVCNTVLPIVFGVLLSDRLPRDRRLHLTELLDSLPAPAGSRLSGKFLGSALATTAPIFLGYSVGIAELLIQRHDPMAIPIALAAFVLINLPGLLFVAAFSIAVPAILWMPLYQFLFVGYWFWGNLLSPHYGIPTLSSTMLTPMGSFAASGFFNNITTIVKGSTSTTYIIVTITGDVVSGWEGALSILLLLTSGAMALFAAHRYLTWQRAQQ